MSQLILENHPLAPLTTWRIGGAAARLAAPADLEDVRNLVRLALERGRPLCSLGPDNKGIAHLLRSIFH